MAKVTLPLLSGEARGQFGKAMIHRRGGVVTKYFTPRNPNSAAQAAQRAAFRRHYVTGLTQAQADLLYAMIVHQHNADDIDSGIFSAARLGSGDAGAGKYLRGDSTWGDYKSSISLFDLFSNVWNTGAGEDDLHNYTIPAGRFAADGDKLFAKYFGYFLGHATATRRVKLYFGGTLLFDTTAMAEVSTTNWECEVWLMRSTATQVKAFCRFQRRTLFHAVVSTTLSGLTLTNSQVLKITGESAGTGGGVSGDVTMQFGTGIFYPSAV